MTIQERLALAKSLVSKRGGQLSTVKELFVSREDYLLDSPGLLQIFRGPLTAGSRIGLGGGTGTGKTSTAKRFVESWRRAFPDRLVLIADFELAEEGSPDRARINNWDIDDNMVQILQWSGSGEGFFDTLYEMVEQQVPISGVIFDSLHSMAPRVSKENVLDDTSQMAPMASMMTNVLRKCTGLLGTCHITQVWILQRRTNPGQRGATANRMGNAQAHYADILLDYTGGIEASTSRLENERNEVYGAVSQVTVKKKRKGPEGMIPMSSTDLYITFDGGIDDQLNLAAVTESRFKTPGRQILTVPLPEDLVEILTEALPPEATTYEAFANGIRVRGGKTSNAEGRLLQMTEMMKACPEFQQYLYADMLSELPKPKQEVYHGEFKYPSQEQLNALLKELDSSDSPV